LVVVVPEAGGFVVKNGVFAIDEQFARFRQSRRDSSLSFRAGGPRNLMKIDGRGMRIKLALDHDLP
jgi:hypothetical protein